MRIFSLYLSYSFVPNCWGEGEGAWQIKCTREEIVKIWFLKMKLFLGHSLKIIKWTWGFFPKTCNSTLPSSLPPTISRKKSRLLEKTLPPAGLSNEFTIKLWLAVTTNLDIFQKRENPQRLTVHGLTLHQKSRVHYLVDSWVNLMQTSVPFDYVNRIIIKQRMSYFPDFF